MVWCADWLCHGGNAVERERETEPEVVGWDTGQWKSGLSNGVAEQGRAPWEP